MKTPSLQLVCAWSLIWLAASCAGRAGAADAAPPENHAPSIHTRIDLPSIAACGPCHEDVFEQWSLSLHHGAWTNANVRQATDDFRKEECRACHSPMPVLATGLDRRPDFRDFNREDGVHCLSCHGLPEGVAATRTIEGAPCRPILEPRLSSAELCYPCHEPTHQAFQEYRQSKAAAAGIRCMDCHMPRDEAGRRSHGPHGGMNPDFVKKAIRWECRMVEGAVEVELRNKTGHKFPGEIPSRSFVVTVRFDRGEPARALLRRPHKQEDREDNRLAPDEVRVLRFELPRGATQATVTLLFKPLPLLPENQAFEIGRWEWP